MQAKSLILLILALGCGVVAAIGVTQMMADSGDKGVVSAEVEPIYVAIEDIEMGRPISVEVISLEDWPKGKVPVGGLSQLEDVEGRVPKTKIFAGEPLLDDKLLTKGEMQNGADIMIPKGYRLKPVKVDEVSGGAEMILPGNRVDVYLSVKKSSEFKEDMVRQILQNVKVFAVDNTWTRTVEDQKTIRAKTVSLLLLPAQAMKVTLAAQTGTLSLVLRSPEDDAATEIERVSIIDLFGGTESADTKKDSNIYYEEDEPTDNTQNFLDLLKGTAVETWRTRVIMGKQLMDMEMERPMEIASDSAVDQPASSGFWRITTPVNDWAEQVLSGTVEGADETAEDAPADWAKEEEELQSDKPNQPLE